MLNDFDDFPEFPGNKQFLCTPERWWATIPLAIVNHQDMQTLTHELMRRGCQHAFEFESVFLGTCCEAEATLS